ncbi:MAG: polyprenol monophosphomannose synthase [Candidatus Limnocylindrales bacterium]
MSDAPTMTAATTEAPPYADVWVVVPTYNEADNLAGISTAILEQLPGATLLVVDDASPDGTGRLADELAGLDPHVKVRHRAGKLGLGKAYVDGFAIALDGGAQRIVQMDADWSHDPRYLRPMLAALAGGDGDAGSPGADLVIGSRYVKGGGVRDWGLPRRIVSRGGSVFARTVLSLSPHDLTGAYKAWRRSALASTPWDRLHSGGYVFSIEMTYLATRRGVRIVELPIIFTDRRVGVSKMSRRIIGEALLVVLRLRWEQFRSQHPRTQFDAPAAQTE